MKNETPSDAIFNEIKEAAIKIWKTYDDTYGYATEKIQTVNSIANYQDNVMICYRMFDWHNQDMMKAGLSQDAINYINNNK